VFIRALQLLRAHNEGVVLVGLGGASGSGKTAFSEKVRREAAAAAATQQQQEQFGSKTSSGASAGKSKLGVLSPNIAAKGSSNDRGCKCGVEGYARSCCVIFLCCIHCR
jgi:hypothetical protein